ncbi:MAG: hypothetical protein IT364_12490 [Candidatus Hydrogenedentes bacterium]|nr:hypothetical protein [Candidatus Hydrogenedentota bacterium]
MDTPPDPPRSREKSSRALGCVVAACILFVVLVFAAVWSVSSYVGGVNARIADLEAGIRERGQPLTLDELNAYYPAVPDDENAALVYAEAFALMDAIDPGREQEAALWDRLVGLDPGAEVPPDLRADMEAYLDARAEVLAILDRAAEFPQAHYSVDFDQGMEMDLPHLAKLRSCARLEVIRGTVAAVDGGFDEYTACHRRVLSMANSLSREPAVISQLVRAVLHSIAAEALIRDLNRAPMPRDTLDELARLYTDCEIPDCLSRSVAGEWCLWVSALRALSADANVDRTADVQFMDAAMKKSGAAGVFQHLTKLRYLEVLKLLEPLTVADDVPWPERLRVASEIESAAEEAAFVNITAQFFLPSVRGAVIALAREAAVLRMTQTVLAVERYRTARGALPDTLQDLVPQFLPEVPEDPFDGKPLRYKHTESGYLVYSVYANEIDDGGVHWQRKMAEGSDGKRPSNRGTQDNGDWVFEVRR